MEIVLALGIGALAGSGAWLILRPRTFQVIIGLSLLSYAVNIFIVAMGRIGSAAAPVLPVQGGGDPAQFGDPVPQGPEHPGLGAQQPFGRVVRPLPEDDIAGTQRERRHAPVGVQVGGRHLVTSGAQGAGEVGGEHLRPPPLGLLDDLEEVHSEGLATGSTVRPSRSR